MCWQRLLRLITIEFKNRFKGVNSFLKIKEVNLLNRERLILVGFSKFKKILDKKLFLKFFMNFILICRAEGNDN